MDLEHLNKTQIILLTLLVSFVTSIATGIATVSLMEKAPTDVTRVISRIIERPIETMTPGAPTIVEERTVVVSEGERIADAVQRIAPSIVRLYVAPGTDEADFKGIGLIASDDGKVIADNRSIDRRSRYVAVLSDGTRLNAERADSEGNQGFLALEREGYTGTFTAATFASFDTLELGQTVIAIAGETVTRIAPGVITELVEAAKATDASRLHATIDGSHIVLGSPLIDLQGRVIGVPETAGSQIFLTLGGPVTQ